MHTEIHLVSALETGAAIERSPGWTAEIGLTDCWIHNETGASHCFGHQTPEYRLISTSVEGEQISRLDLAISQPYRISTLCGLFGIGFIRFAEDGQELTGAATSERYRWQTEYFRQIARRSNDIGPMYERLGNADVCVIGAGGLGSMLAMLLAASGVGRISIVDGDVVSESNLPRQFLYSEDSVGEVKVAALARRLTEHNSAVSVSPHACFVESLAAAIDLTKTSSFIALCADQPRFKIRAWIGAASLANRVPYMAMGGGWIGPISQPFESPCYVCQARTYRARFADPASLIKKGLNEPTPARASFAPRPTIVASFMAAAIIHHLVGSAQSDDYSRSFRLGMRGELEEQRYVRYRDCQACGTEAQKRANGG